jgi:membrane protease YdiL (CAAX protease family)
MQTSNDPFQKINIQKLFMSLYIVLPFLLVLIVFLLLGVFSLVNKLNFDDLIEVEAPIFNGAMSIVFGVSLAYVLFKESKKVGLQINQVIGQARHIDLKLIGLIAVLIFAFSLGFNSLSLYSLSFVFPEYVEEFINEKQFSNIPELIILSFPNIILAPLIEEFFFRGIVLQKWVIKWGVKIGIFTSSLLFVIIHIRFDFIPLFFGAIVLSILYFKTHSLLAPILCHFFYNTIGIIFATIGYFSESAIERNAFISVKDYQASVQPLLGQRVFLIAISVPFLIYFVYKNFPSNNAIIPYYANEAKILETN